jgi:hypothetical protein
MTSSKLNVFVAQLCLASVACSPSSEGARQIEDPGNPVTTNPTETPPHLMRLRDRCLPITGKVAGSGRRCPSR